LDIVIATVLSPIRSPLNIELKTEQTRMHSTSVDYKKTQQALKDVEEDLHKWDYGLGITPFGLYCNRRDCPGAKGERGRTIGKDHRTISRHVLNHHGCGDKKNPVTTELKYWKKMSKDAETSRKRLEAVADPRYFLSGRKNENGSMCGKCGKTFTRIELGKKHYAANKNTCLILCFRHPVCLHETICGRWISVSLQPTTIESRITLPPETETGQREQEATEDGAYDSDATILIDTDSDDSTYKH
jgi:hypothetical protein